MCTVAYSDHVMIEPAGVIVCKYLQFQRSLGTAAIYIFWVGLKIHFEFTA